MLKTVQFPGANVLDAAGGLAAGHLPRFAFHPLQLAGLERQYRGAVPQRRTSERRPLLSGGGPELPDRIAGLCSALLQAGLGLLRNLSLTYSWKGSPVGDTQFYATVENLFDRVPTSTVGGSGTVPSLFPGTFGTGDTAIGRFYTAGMRIRL